MGFLKHQQYHRVKGLHQNLSSVHYPNLDSGANEVGGSGLVGRYMLRRWKQRLAQAERGFNKWEDVHLMRFFRVILVKISHLEAWRILKNSEDDLCGL